MKKIFTVAVFVFVALTMATSVMAETFDPPNRVYLSGDASGKLYFKSDFPAALDVIEGVTQFRNDIQKRNGTGANKNAFRNAERVNPNLFTVQLFPGTLRRQFSFNTRNGSLWGMIPSCNLIPDGKTVIIEDSRPRDDREKKDSEDGLGGMHFSLIAHLANPPADTAPVLFDTSGCGSYTAPAAPAYAAPAPQTRVITPAPAPSKKVRIASVPKKEPCDVCEKLGEIVTTTGIINRNVGEATPEEKAAGLGDAHKKLTDLKKTVGTPSRKGDTVARIAERTEKNSGTIIGQNNGMSKSIDMLNKKSDAIMKKMGIAPITAPTSLSNPPAEKTIPQEWGLLALALIAILIGAVLVFRFFRNKKQQSTTP